MMGVEMASSNWGGLYFQDVYGMDPAKAGADFVAAFFAAFTLSRLVSGFFIEKIGYMRSLIGAAAAIGAVFALGFVLGAKGIYVLPAAGFFIAILWPTLMAAAIRFFGSAAAPVMTAGVIAIAGIVNAGMQLFMGSLNKYAGAAWGYRSCFVFTAVLLVILMRLNGMIRGASRGEAAV
jgi:fucose permease